MSYSKPKVTIDLKEYEHLLSMEKRLREQEGKAPLNDKQIYNSFILMSQAQRGAINAPVLDKKLAEIGVSLINVPDHDFSFILRPL